MEEFEYFVMDGRFHFDPERSAVLEACGTKRPSDRYLKRDYEDMGAVLVRAPIFKKDAKGNSSCGEFEYLRDI